MTNSISLHTCLRHASNNSYTRVNALDMGKLVELHKSERSYMERIGLLMAPRHLTSLNDKAPALVQLMYDRYGILPRHLIFVEVVQRKAPYIHEGRYEITVFHKDEYSSIIAVTVQFGFMRLS